MASLICSSCCGDFSPCSCHAGVRASRSVGLNETILKFAHVQ